MPKKYTIMIITRQKCDIYQNRLHNYVTPNAAYLFGVKCDFCHHRAAKRLKNALSLRKM